MLFEPGDNSFQAIDDLLPAVLRALIVGLLIGTEAGLLHAHVSTRIGWCQRKRDDGLDAQSAPGVRKSPAGFHGEYLAVNDAVPVRHRFPAQSERMTRNWLKVILHEPLLHQRALGKGPPHFLRWMRKFFFDDQRPCRSVGLRHLSILSRTSASRSNLSCQKAP